MKNRNVITDAAIGVALVTLAVSLTTMLVSFLQVAGTNIDMLGMSLKYRNHFVWVSVFSLVFGALSGVSAILMLKRPGIVGVVLQIAAVAGLVVFLCIAGLNREYTSIEQMPALVDGGDNSRYIALQMSIAPLLALSAVLAGLTIYRGIKAGHEEDGAVPKAPKPPKPPKAPKAPPPYYPGYNAQGYPPPAYTPPPAQREPPPPDHGHPPPPAHCYTPPPPAATPTYTPPPPTAAPAYTPPPPTAAPAYTPPPSAPAAQPAAPAAAPVITGYDPKTGAPIYASTEPEKE
jgi:hypothetical protein